MASQSPDVSCAVVVLNWNGRAHLEHLLPTLYAARDTWGKPLPITVVDNRGMAGDVAWLTEAHPTVDVVIAPSNDFLFSLNPVVASRSEDFVIVLNNDMRVDPGFVAPLLAHFADPAVFAVASVVFNWDGTERQIGQRLIRIERFWCYHWFDCTVSHSCYTIEAGGGCSAYRRTHFAALGGFDRLFHPAYWEDFDLSYRAWMRGWTSIFEPRSIIYHRGSATLSETMPGGRMGRIMARNQLLFVLKNVGGWGFVAGALALLPYRVVVNATRGHWQFVSGTFSALPRVASALIRRWHRPPPKLTPEAIAASVGPAPGVVAERASPVAEAVGA